ncbi:putative ubiquitin-conjugating enzyme E2 33 [Vitis vinifera]|uniref:Putative ubiquitin-conjugating enzyme E2 33 n=1 Tax=Vitis vinifera TaxID=29760 RepID=A0A438EWP5_VITVI|nr:putative ubiquitin-conjugating enzyme E2 33 [Vitis vinifera]
MERNLEPHHSFPLPLETWVIIQSIVALALQELKEQYRVSTFVFTTIQSWEMAEKSCVKRLQKNIEHSVKNQFPMWLPALPQMIFLSGNVLKWIENNEFPLFSLDKLTYTVGYYVLEGSEGTPFAGGYYYGKIKFPPEYPYKPPGISMTTPNGRFMTQKKICLSMSDFHPESWNPMWSVSSILTGLLSFMERNNEEGKAFVVAEEDDGMEEGSPSSGWLPLVSSWGCQPKALKGDFGTSKKNQGVELKKLEWSVSYKWTNSENEGIGSGKISARGL